MFTDYDVGKFLARRRLLHRRVNSAGATNTARKPKKNKKTQRYEYTMSFPAKNPFFIKLACSEDMHIFDGP